MLVSEILIANRPLRDILSDHALWAANMGGQALHFERRDFE